MAAVKAICSRVLLFDPPCVITNNVKNSYKNVVEEVIINILYLKLQLLSATRRDSGAFIFQQNCHIAQDTHTKMPCNIDVTCTDVKMLTLKFPGRMYVNNVETLLGSFWGHSIHNVQLRFTYLVDDDCGGCFVIAVKLPVAKKINAFVFNSSRCEADVCHPKCHPMCRLRR